MGNEFGDIYLCVPQPKCSWGRIPNIIAAPAQVYSRCAVYDILSRAGLWRQPRRRQDTFQTRSQNTVHCNNFTQPAVSSFPYVSCRRTRDTARIRRCCWAPGDRRCPSISPAARRSAANPPPHGSAAVERWDRQTDGRTDGRTDSRPFHIDHAPHNVM